MEKTGAVLGIIWAGVLVLRGTWRSGSLGHPALFGAFAALCLSVLGLFVDSLWLALGAWSLAHWFWGWSLWSRQQPEERSGSPAMLFAGLVSDGLWVTALLFLESAGINLQFSALLAAAGDDRLSSLDKAFWALAAFAMLASLMIRSALFPVQVWLRDCLRTPLDAAWVSGLLLPLNACLLLRFEPLYSPIIEVRQAMMGIGGLSLSFLALLSVGQDTLPRRLAFAISSLMGLVWMAAGVGGAGLSVMAILAMLCGLIVTVALSVSTSSGQRKTLALFVMLLLGTGLCGQQMLFDDLQELSRSTLDAASMTPDEVVSSGVTSVAKTPRVSLTHLYAVPIGLSLLCYSVCRGLLDQGGGWESTVKRGRFPTEQTCLLAVSLILACGILGTALYATLSSRDGVISPGLTSLALLGGGWAWRESLTGSASFSTPRSSSMAFHRAMAEEFYSRRLVQSLVIKPFLLAVNTLRFIDQQMVERLFFGTGRQIARLVDISVEAIQPPRHDSSASGWILALMTVLVLTIATFAAV